MSRIRKYNPRNGKGGLLLPPNLLVFVLAQLGPGRLPLPTSLLNDSQRGGQERGSKVLSLQIRVEQSPRSGKARFPGPTPSSLPSAVLLRSSPSEPPSFRRSDRSLSRPRHPQGDPAPRSSPWRGTALPATPVKDLQTSGSSVSRGTAPSQSLHSPATSATPPIHFRPAPGPNEAFAEAPPLPYVPAYVPARKGTVSLFEWSLPGEAPRTISSSLPDTQIPGGTSRILSSYCSRTEIGLTKYSQTPGPLHP